MAKNKLKVKIKPFGFMDLLAFKNLVPQRRKRIESASDKPAKVPAVNKLAIQLHPDKQYLVISEVKNENSIARTFRLVPDKEKGTTELAYFRPGQYLCLKVLVNDVVISRPYSISSSPRNALEGYYEITIKKTTDGFVSDYIWENWKVGDKIEGSGPEGHFYYEELRDTKKIVGLAGGSGITPFRSIARSIVDDDLKASLTLLYGSNSKEEIIFFEEFKKLEEKSKGRVKVIHVISGENSAASEGTEKGFLTAKTIQKYTDPVACSFFICGPQVMYSFLEKELSMFNLPPKRIRREVFGEIKNINTYPGFPEDSVGKTYKIRVIMGQEVKEIPAIATESVLVALERAGMAPPSRCRSGLCGFCRSQLVKGNVFIPEESDGRRAADKIYGFIHTCSSFPISDLELIVPRDK